MSAYLPFTNIDLDASDIAERNALAAESMGWQPLGQGAYLHHGTKDDPEAEAVILVVGIPDTAWAGLNVLLLT